MRETVSGLKVFDILGEESSFSLHPAESTMNTKDFYQWHWFFNMSLTIFFLSLHLLIALIYLCPCRLPLLASSLYSWPAPTSNHGCSTWSTANPADFFMATLSSKPWGSRRWVLGSWPDWGVWRSAFRKGLLTGNDATRQSVSGLQHVSF